VFEAPVDIILLIEKGWGNWLARKSFPMLSWGPASLIAKFLKKSIE
jgi:hypothetical protein